jgi:hypothetical protein
VNSTKVLIAAALIAAVLLCSGCIFCCGLDSQLSKYKKSVTALDLPGNTTIDGLTYHLARTDTRLNRSDVQAGILSVLGELAYPPEDVETAMKDSMSTSGIYEYQYFNYTDETGHGTFGIYVAKTDSPFTVTSGFESLRQLLDSSMWFLNNQGYNWGGVNNISHVGSSTIGDGGEKYTADVFGKPSYTVILKYSNLYVLAYSFESFQVAEDATRMAIKQIDIAAADP